jgi:CubicO group peptidase (beta-lactamase class C family)
MKMTCLMAWGLALCVSMVATGAGGQELTERWGVPASPTGTKLATLLEAVDRGDPEWAREALAEQLSPSLRGDPAVDQMIAALMALHEALPDIRPNGVRRAPNGGTVEIRSSVNQGTSSISFETDADGWITSVETGPVQIPDSAPATDLAALDRLMVAAADAGTFGGVFARWADGDQIMGNAYGLADRRGQTPVTFDTRFNIGSLIKAFTAAAVLRLHEDGRLDLDATLDTWIDGLPDGVGDRVTVRHLLQHRSGWGHYWDNPAFNARITELRDIDDYLDFLVELPLTFEPGSEELYSNVGYEFLGIIVGRVAESSYYDAVQELVFDPLGMDRTGFPMRDRTDTDVAIGYTSTHPLAGPGDGYTWENTFMFAPRGTPAGGGYSTASDLHRFWSGVAEGRLLAPRATALFFSNYVEGADDPISRRTYMGGGPGVVAGVTLDGPRGTFTVLLSNVDDPVTREVMQAQREITSGG